MMAKKLLRESLSVNRVQQRTSINFYNTQRRNGTLSQHADTSSQVAREGSLAQALSIVGSQPSGPDVRHLREQVDSVQHQSDPLMTQFGSIRDIGIRRSAAGDRVRNNVLMMNPAQPDVMDLTDSPVQGDLAFGNGADLDFLAEHELLSIGASESMLTASGAASTSAAPNATLGLLLPQLLPICRLFRPPQLLLRLARLSQFLLRPPLRMEPLITSIDRLPMQTKCAKRTDKMTGRSKRGHVASRFRGG